MSQNKIQVIFQSFCFYKSLKESRKNLLFSFICYRNNSGTIIRLKITLPLSCRKFNFNTDYIIFFRFIVKNKTKK